MGQTLITLDTSGLFALLNRRDTDHERVKTALFEDRGPYLIPAGILAEIACMVEERFGARALESLVVDLESGGLTLEYGEEDLPRIRELVRRYEDLPLQRFSYRESREESGIISHKAARFSKLYLKPETYFAQMASLSANRCRFRGRQRRVLCRTRRRQGLDPGSPAFRRGRRGGAYLFAPVGRDL